MEETEWEPGNSAAVEESPRGDAIVGIWVGYNEEAQRLQVKKGGGVWNPEEWVWELRYDRVVELGLTERIVAEPGQSLK